MTMLKLRVALALKIFEAIVPRRLVLSTSLFLQNIQAFCFSQSYMNFTPISLFLCFEHC